MSGLLIHRPGCLRTLWGSYRLSRRIQQEGRDIREVDHALNDIEWCAWDLQDEMVTPVARAMLRRIKHDELERIAARNAGSFGGDDA